jgi:hypothetical protein
MLDEMGAGKRPARDREPERDEDEDDRPRPRRRGRDDERDDRPRPRRRPDAGPPPKKGMGVGTVLAIVGGILLLCCGGVGAVGYYLFQKGQEFVEKAREQLETHNPRVTRQNFETLKVGESTRADAERLLGNGRVATSDDLNKVFSRPGPDSRNDINSWSPKVVQNRVLIWQNGEDYLLALFHPNADPDSRLQAKQYVPKGGSTLSSGQFDDAAFLQAHPPGPKGGVPPGPPTEVKAEDLAKEFNDNLDVAHAKYMDKLLIVEGKLRDIDAGPGDDEITARLEGTPGAGTQIRCVIPARVAREVWNTSRGQTIKFQGRYRSASPSFIDLADGQFQTRGPDPGVTVSAPQLLLEYARGDRAADMKYKDKAITVTSARVERVSGVTLYLVPPVKSKKGGPDRIKVTIPSTLKSQIANLKPGDQVRVKGECAGMSKEDGVVSINRAWIAP